ncbi:MAG: hypothetical protein EOO04_25630 [Chitinophagaceae bacterium]|nr:MAG: hypothetical protein EOO04_25630 [Chitinophagaceae bacterium]
MAVVITSVVFFILVIFCISYFMIYKRKRKQHQDEMLEFKKQFEHQLLKVQVEVQEQTFLQIGKELHDNVGQLLSTAKVLLGLTERTLGRPLDTLVTANSTVGEAIQQLRLLSKSLDKEWLERFDFIENLRMEISRVNHDNFVTGNLEVNTILHLESSEQIILFRIVQEALQNAVKHSDGTSIKILVEQIQDVYKILIEDNGKGFEISEKDMGMGLANMKYRTHLLNGSIEWRSQAGEGTSVTLILPAKLSSHEN